MADDHPYDHPYGRLDDDAVERLLRGEPLHGDKPVGADDPSSRFDDLGGTGGTGGGAPGAGDSAG
ncbi:hypothetical protein ADK38_44300, partial [Streptomyces varsoviensis]